MPEILSARPRAPRAWTITTLRWGVGMFAVLLGAMMLIVPHRFEGAAEVLLHPQLLAWGLSFLLAGTGLLAAVALPPGVVSVAAHLAAGAVFVAAGFGFAATGGVLRAAGFLALGLGTLIAPRLEPREPARAAAAGPDLLVLVLAATGVIAAVLFSLPPATYLAHFPAGVRPELHWYAVAFGLAGLGLAYTQCAPGISRLTRVLFHLAAAATFLGFVNEVGISARDWSALVYFGAFAAFLAAFPWLDVRLKRVDPLSLRSRLALVLTLAAAAPLIAAASLVTEWAEQSATAEALLLQRTIAGTVADDIARDLGFYRATVAGLAKTINFVQMPAGRQNMLLWSLVPDYLEVFSFGTYDARGALLARSDARADASIATSPVFAQAVRMERAGAGDRVAVTVVLSPAGERLLFEFGAPLRGKDGVWSGLLVVSVESGPVMKPVLSAAGETKGSVYVVDGQGRVLADDAGDASSVFRDVSGLPPVAALLSHHGAAGAVRYRAGEAGAEQLAGYAPVEGTEFGVVMERPVPVALAGVRGGREVAFGLLLLAVIGAAVGGVYVAGMLVRPIEALARESRRLGIHGASAAPLPETRITEIRELTETFCEMRDRLAARTQERERAHGAVREREARIRSILDSTSDGFIFLGRDGRIKSVNHRAAVLLPLGDAWRAEGSVLGALAGLDAPAEARDGIAALIRSFAATGEAAGEGDLELGGGRRVLHWDAQPARDDAGAAVGLTLTLRDVTHEREVSRMKSDFVAFVTHQLRTPLSGIKWLLELAAGTRDVEEAHDYIRDAQEANERLTALVNNLLNISRLESGRLVVSPEALDLGKITESVLAELGPLIHDKRQRLSLRGGDRVPPIVADPQLIRQVVLNLVANAVKYTPPAGAIRVELGQENGNVRLAVADTGIGIPRDALPRLFEKFYRADNVQKIETEGTGLGLYLVRLIVERLGGRIWCESEEGRGATFQFTVPVAGGDAGCRTARASGS